MDMNSQEDLQQTAPERQSFLSAVVGELTRRKVLRTVGVYAVAVFAVLQLMDAAAEPLRLPDWLPTLMVITLILGFPVVFLLAWQFEFTPKGVRRTQAAGLLSRSQSAFLFSFMMAATLGLGYVFYEYYSGVFEDSAAVPEAASAAEREFSAPQNSIAILPFTDLSAEGDQANFADGITEELLNLLAQVEGLHVAARTSSFAFRDPQTDIREIGRLLNVRTVLEGSVRSSGNRIRLTAQLINVADGFHIWSQVYDREMADLFTIQDEIASKIADALVDSFESLQAGSTGRSENLAAAQAYRTGRLMWWRRTPADLQRAIELFATALQHDANFAPAYAAMADTWLLLSLYGNVAPLEAMENAHPMIEKALAIDPASPEAYAALGLARANLGQLDAAESALRHAIELNEDYIPAHVWLSTVLESQGRYPEQQVALEKAMALDPLNELLAINYAGNLSVRGEWERARTVIGGLIELRPDSPMLLRFLADHEILHGNLAEGFRLAYRSYSLHPDDPSDVTMMASAWLNLGALDEAQELLADGLEKHPNNAKLQEINWQLMLIAGRLEEARSLVRQSWRDAGEALPDYLERNFNFQLGLVSLREGDYPAACSHLSAAIDVERGSAYDRLQTLVLSMAALACGREGKAEESARLMADAQRDVRRARVNGVDDPDINYTEAVMLAMNDDIDPAVAKLRDAYEAGFRQMWLLEIDPRIDAIRSHPGFVEISEQIQQDISAARAAARSLAVATL